MRRLYLSVQAVTVESLNFSDATSAPVISAAQKFIIKVPAFAGGGEPLIHRSTEAVKTYQW